VRCLLSLLTLMLLPPHASADLMPRPPRLPAAARHFGRALQPAQPRTGVALELGQLWGGTVEGMEPEQLALVFVVEASHLLPGTMQLGLHLAAPVVFDRVSTEGVYGRGDARARGAGDLGLGATMLLRSFRPWGRLATLAVKLELTAPTGGDRWVQPQTPMLPAPRYQLGPARWGIVSGPTLGLEMGRLTLQLDADLMLHVVDERDRPGWHNRWLFGGVALNAAYRPLRWLTQLLALETQLEMYGRQYALRQLLFAVAAIRLHPLTRLDLDLGLRVPLTGEARDAQRLSFGITVGVGLGPREDHAW